MALIGEAIDISKVWDEVPEAMQKLARFICRCFYGIEFGLVTDALVRNLCMREDDLRELLKFDAKQLRQVLLVLKSEKLIKERQIAEERPDSNRPVRFNYYFINYKALLNVFKYKMDHIRKKLDAEEKQAIYRAMYKCSSCGKTYGDLDVGKLWNGAGMACYYCQGAVIEDASALPDSSARSLMAKFNEQMMPFVSLLRQCEDIRLADHLLEPTPQGRGLSSSVSSGGVARPRFTLGGRATDDSSRQGQAFNLHQNFNVIIEGQVEGAATDSQAGIKQVPVWLQQSPVDLPSKPELLTVASTVTNDAIRFNDESSASATTTLSTEVESLLAHERSRPNVVSAPAAKHESTSDEESEFEDVDDEFGGLEVSVGGRKVPLSEVTVEMVKQMTSQEKEEYSRVSSAVTRLYD